MSIMIHVYRCPDCKTPSLGTEDEVSDCVCGGEYPEEPEAKFKLPEEIVKLSQYLEPTKGQTEQ